MVPSAMSAYILPGVVGRTFSWRGLAEIRGARMPRADFAAVAFFHGWKNAGVPATEMYAPPRPPRRPNEAAETSPNRSRDPAGPGQDHQRRPQGPQTRVRDRRAL